MYSNPVLAIMRIIKILGCSQILDASNFKAYWSYCISCSTLRKITDSDLPVSARILSISCLCLCRDTHGIATKNDRIVPWLMIFLAVSSSTVAVFSDMYSIFSVDKDIGG